MLLIISTGGHAGYYSSGDGVNSEMANIRNASFFKPTNFFLNRVCSSALGQHTNVEVEQGVTERAGLAFIGAEPMNDNAPTRFNSFHSFGDQSLAHICVVHVQDIGHEY